MARALWTCLAWNPQYPSAISDSTQSSQGRRSLPRNECPRICQRSWVQMSLTIALSKRNWWLDGYIAEAELLSRPTVAFNCIPWHASRTPPPQLEAQQRWPQRNTQNQSQHLHCCWLRSSPQVFYWTCWAAMTQKGGSTKQQCISNEEQTWSQKHKCLTANISVALTG